MTKDELAEKLSSACDSKKQAGDVVDAFVNTVTETLAAGDEIRLTGFGTFTISHRKARAGVNPRTGEKLQIPARKAPVFRAGKALKEAVNV